MLLWLYYDVAYHFQGFFATSIYGHIQGELDSIPVMHPTVDTKSSINLSNSYYIPVCCLVLYMTASPATVCMPFTSPPSSASQAPLHTALLSPKHMKLSPYCLARCFQMFPAFYRPSEFYLLFLYLFILI